MLRIGNGLTRLVRKHALTAELSANAPVARELQAKRHSTWGVERPDTDLGTCPFQRDPLAVRREPLIDSQVGRNDLLRVHRSFVAAASLTVLLRVGEPPSSASRRSEHRDAAGVHVR